jgi:anti-sigma regulatory factor (Ser/Thr protein kinase)
MKCQDIRVQVRADPKLLRSIRELLRTYVVGCGFPQDTVDSVVLAVDEACANAIRHSYGGSCDEKLELWVAYGEDEGLEVVLSDEGIPAPRECLQPKELEPPSAATVRPGGLGVQLMFQAFDEVLFCPGTERGNRVVMRLRQRRRSG